ncbi:hypothetical protein FACS1894163_04720 [Spirochaetia bacterium]|nr:hypothetical protein FACS1894163_04720 [Spirochaetia bacterium]
MENTNNNDPSAAEQFRADIKDALFAGDKKAAEIGQRLSPSSAGGAAMQLGEIGASMAKPLGKAAVHGGQAFVEATPPELRPPVLSSYEDKNGNIKWGHFPASDSQSEKFDFKKDKAERQQTSQNSGQTSKSHDEKTTSQFHSKESGQSR